MAKMKTSILIIGAMILVLVSVVSTYLILLATNVIHKDPIKIEITIVDKEKIYDGTPLQADSYNLDSGKLLDGHTLSLDYIGSITDYGTIKSNAVCHVYDADHTDYTNSYLFTVNQGNLTIHKKTVAFKVKDKSIDYVDDADFINKCEYEVVSGSLCSGHKAVPTYLIKNEDFVRNEVSTGLSVDVFDINGVNVTNNYDINYRDGLVDINKQKLVYKTLSKTKVYDGEAFGEDDLNVSLDYGELPIGYKADIVYDYAAKGDVGKTVLGVTSCRIVDNLGDDVTNKFDITIVPEGVLTITPFELYIELNEEVATFEYDGKEKSYYEFKIKDIGVSLDSDNSKFEYNDKDYSVEAIDYTKAVNAGSYVNDVKFIIRDNFDEEVTDNFRVNLSTAIITITKRNLILYGDSETKEYDGNTHKIEESTPTKTPQGLVDDHKVTVEYSEASRIKDAGSVPTEIFSWQIKDEKGNDVTSNYNVTTVNGLYTITKVKVEIEAKVSGSDDNLSEYPDFYGNNIYDQTDLKSIVDYKTASGIFTLEVSKFNYEQIKHAGVYNILPTEYKLLEGGKEIEEDKLINYDILVSSFDLIIKKTAVFITVESKTVEQGSGRERLDYKVTMQDDYGEFEDDFSITAEASKETVGTFNVGVVFESEDDDSSLDDYVIFITPGILTVVEP